MSVYIVTLYIKDINDSCKSLISNPSSTTWSRKGKHLVPINLHSSNSDALQLPLTEKKFKLLIHNQKISRNPKKLKLGHEYQQLRLRGPRELLQITHFISRRTRTRIEAV